MSTVSKKIADDVLAGKYPEDRWVQVIEYDDAWGGVAYGLENAHSIGRYSPSEYVRNPRLYGVVGK